MAYLDHAATTPVRPQAREAWLAAPDGNASSLHGSGRLARRVLEEAREALAAELGCDAGDVIFTSGGTMADNLALRGIHAARRAENPERDTVVVSAVEHHAVLDTAMAMAEGDARGTHGEAAHVVQIPVDHMGRVRLDAAAQVLDEHGARITVLSVMSANNEVGTVQPIAELAALAERHGVPLHVDAVQSVGWWGAPPAPGAAISISGHKFGAPVGIGALVLPPAVPCKPLIFGGGQERRLHSGTLDVAGAAAMAAALRSARESDLAGGEPGVTVADLRDELMSAVQTAVPDAVVMTPADALPGIVSVMFEGCEADALLMLLDAEGVECSTGSACTAGIPEPSHVLEAMGASGVQARSALRFSLGWTSTRADIDALAAVLPNAVARARRASAGPRRAQTPSTRRAS